MAKIIDVTYFTKEPLFIPNSTTIAVRTDSSSPVSVDLLQFIEICVRDVLIKAMGLTNYNALIVDMEKTPFETGAGSAADDKWVKLVNGTDYTKDGVEYRWDGLRGFSKNSFLAHYVKCAWLLETTSHTTVSGQITLKSENSIMVTGTSKFVRSWQFFLSKYQQLDNNEPNILFNEFGSQELNYHTNKNVNRSLYQYMIDTNLAAPGTFTDFEFGLFSIHESYNSFDI